MTLNEFLDYHYGADGDVQLRRRLADGADPNFKEGPYGETALHVAARRRRLGAVEILLEHGADKNAVNAGGKTAYAHAKRRTFVEIAQCLADAGCDTQVNEADLFAIALGENRMDEARSIFAKSPQVIKTGNPEEDRLLADVAGRMTQEPVRFLVENGADLTVPGLDDGMPLHIAAWFGQPEAVRLLANAGAPLEIFDRVHASSPLGWAVHGSRYSGGAEEVQEKYVEIVRILLEAGAKCHYPGDPTDDAYYERLLDDAAPPIRKELEALKNK